MMMIRIVLVVASAISLILSNWADAGTQAPKTASKTLTVGFSQVGAESAWRTAETESIKHEAAERGVDLKFADAQGKQASQIAAVRSFIAQKVDVIVIAPIVETGWEPILREARR